MVISIRYRRILVTILILLGAAFIFFAPSSPTDMWIGAVFASVGVLIEIIGITIAHRNGKI
jgi:hypothetical protein